MYILMLDGHPGQMVDKEPFDSRLVSKFAVGNLVSWQETTFVCKYGFIEKIYSQKLGEDREFMFAKVKKTDGSTENFMLSVLTLESGNKKDIQ